MVKTSLLKLWLIKGFREKVKNSYNTKEIPL